MQGIRIKEKVKVFISSNCGGRYTVVREALYQGAQIRTE